jgi:glutamate 5-kinase
MDQKSFHFHEKKRVVVKIGSSSLNYEETGSLNFTKLEHLVRELCNLRNRGMDVCLVSSGAIAVGRQSLGMTERPRETHRTERKTGMCSSRTGKTDDDLPEAVCRI